MFTDATTLYPPTRPYDGTTVPRGVWTEPERKEFSPNKPPMCSTPLRTGVKKKPRCKPELRTWV
jgi:hypothetical protein